MARRLITTAEQREEHGVRHGVKIGLRYAARVVEKHLGIGPVKLLAVGMAQALTAMADDPDVVALIITDSKK